MSLYQYNSMVKDKRGMKFANDEDEENNRINQTALSSIQAENEEHVGDLPDDGPDMDRGPDANLISSCT